MNSPVLNISTSTNPMMASPRQIQVLAAITVTLVLMLIHNSVCASHGDDAHSEVFVLAVTVKFKKEADIDRFTEYWKPVAEHCKHNEPGTLSYKMMRSDKEPTQILILERYATKHDYLEVHKKSAPFLLFRPQLAALEPELSGHSFVESSEGYM